MPFRAELPLSPERNRPFVISSGAAGAVERSVNIITLYHTGRSLDCARDDKVPEDLLLQVFRHLVIQ